MKNSTDWFSHFRESISDYAYYVDFAKIHRNVDEVKIELNILNTLIGLEHQGLLKPWCSCFKFSPWTGLTWIST